MPNKHKRYFFLLMMGLAGLVFLSFRMSYSVQTTEDSIAQLKHQLRQDEQALKVLDAEWAYLTRPERLKQLVAQYSDMQPVVNSGLITLAALPERGAAQLQPTLASHPAAEKAAPHAAKPQAPVIAAAPRPLPRPRAPQPEANAAPVPAGKASVWDVLTPLESDGGHE